MRAIARDAGVDPSLVHHYFDGKAALFVAALDLPADPRDVKDQIEVATSARGADNGSATNDEPVDDDSEDAADSEAPGPPLSGAVVVELFLAQWEDGDPPGGRFRAMAQAVSSSPSVAEATRQFLAERVWSRIPRVAGEDETSADRRSALVAAQLVGLAWGRYVLRTEPLVAAPLAEIGRWVGPTIDRYMTADLDG